MTDNDERGVHLHGDDYAATLALLTVLFERKLHDPVGLADIGYAPSDTGAWVNWDLLAASWLSSTEKAVVHIARGSAILERAGGPPPRLTALLRQTITAVTPMSPEDIEFFDRLAGNQTSRDTRTVSVRLAAAIESVADPRADGSRYGYISADQPGTALYAETAQILAEHGVTPTSSQQSTLRWLCTPDYEPLADVIELVLQANTAQTSRSTR